MPKKRRNRGAAAGGEQSGFGARGSTSRDVEMQDGHTVPPPTANPNPITTREGPGSDADQAFINAFKRLSMLNNDLLTKLISAVKAVKAYYITAFDEDIT